MGQQTTLDLEAADRCHRLVVQTSLRVHRPTGPPANLSQAIGADMQLTTTSFFSFYKGADTLFTQSGYTPIRFGYVMVRPNLDPVSDARLPDGLEIRPVEEAHLRPIWDAAVEAFRDAWGFVEPTDRDYELYATDPIQSDHSLWRVAWDGDEVAGQVRSFINVEENARHNRLRGYTEHISVRRPWRKRGLARALIAETVDALRERGMTEGALNVDTENVSGALRLYESVGFRPVSRSTTYRKPIQLA